MNADEAGLMILKKREENRYVKYGTANQLLCLDCGATVGEKIIHNAFHRKLDICLI